MVEIVERDHGTYVLDYDHPLGRRWEYWQGNTLRAVWAPHPLQPWNEAPVVYGCRVCDTPTSVDYAGRPLWETFPASFVCSMPCLTRFMTYLLPPERDEGDDDGECAYVARWGVPA